MLTLLLTILGFQLTPPPAIAPPEQRTEIVEAYSNAMEESSDYVNRRNGDDNGVNSEKGGEGEFSPSDGIKPMPPRDDSHNYEVDGEGGNGGVMPLPLTDGSGRVDTGSLADRKRSLDERFSRMFELQSSLNNRILELQADSEEYSLLKRAYSRELRRIIDDWVKEF